MRHISTLHIYIHISVQNPTQTSLPQHAVNCSIDTGNDQNDAMSWSLLHVLWVVIFNSRYQPGLVSIGAYY